MSSNRHKDTETLGATPGSPAPSAPTQDLKQPTRRQPRAWNVMVVHDSTLPHPIYQTQARAYEVGMALLQELVNEILDHQWSRE